TRQGVVAPGARAEPAEAERHERQGEGGAMTNTRRRKKPEAAKPAALVATELTKDYGGLVALSPTDLRVELHEAVVLIGHNGSGKTTLLRMAAGLLEPSAGSLTLAGNAAGSMPARAACAYLSDTPTFY